MLEYKEYDLLGNLEDEVDALEQFVSESDGSSYICDAISEIADSFIPIYYNDIWENARNIQQYIEEGKSEGLAEGVDDLDKLFQVGYFVFYTRSLYKNLDTMAYNIMVREINDYLADLDEEAIGILDFDELEEKIEELTEDYDNSNRLSDIIEEAQGVIEELKDGGYRLLDEAEAI